MRVSLGDSWKNLSALKLGEVGEEGIGSSGCVRLAACSRFSSSAARSAASG